MTTVNVKATSAEHSTNSCKETKLRLGGTVVLSSLSAIKEAQLLQQDQVHQR